ncbi:hypothetical protein RKE29_25025 [Streptomyces sp. B1866]|uniref:hypothetical protein n=1 Tax=Streptomyces sp. B1866 TaxID=3075431 RepID=UPI00288D4DAC|nr:hypothetical protein [Streptomyces sp. B1866]MDT3399859.1 hypothetical protein [Streptomyces sp. B1866]
MNTEEVDYTNLPGFRGVYLEDSFVTDIEARPGRLSFRLDLVLTPEHPTYLPPRPGEQHCYREAVIEFTDVRRLVWAGQGTPPATDSSGTHDYGGADSFVATGNVYRIEGDWGEIEIESEAPYIRFLSAYRG